MLPSASNAGILRAAASFQQPWYVHVVQGGQGEGDGVLDVVRDGDWVCDADGAAKTMERIVLETQSTWELGRGLRSKERLGVTAKPQALTTSATVPHPPKVQWHGPENWALVPTPSAAPAVNAVPASVMTAPVDAFSCRIVYEPRSACGRRSKKHGFVDAYGTHVRTHNQSHGACSIKRDSKGNVKSGHRAKSIRDPSDPALSSESDNSTRRDCDTADKVVVSVSDDGDCAKGIHRNANGQIEGGRCADAVRAPSGSSDPC